jgi:hypothetical protein
MIFIDRSDIDLQARVNQELKKAAGEEQEFLFPLKYKSGALGIYYCQLYGAVNCHVAILL